MQPLIESISYNTNSMHKFLQLIDILNSDFDSTVDSDMDSMTIKPALEIILLK